LEEDYLMAKKLKRLVEQLEQRITAIERALASSRVTDAAPEPTAMSGTDRAESVNTPLRKRPLSAEARERIAAAQRKRWALKRKATPKATKRKAA
jgi:Mg2+ and Co2+ transporter CorA